MHQIKKIRALYFLNFFMKFDEMQSLFHFVRVLVSFETNQIKVLFLFFISSGLADFFSIGNNKNLPSWIFQNVKKYALIKSLQMKPKHAQNQKMIAFHQISWKSWANKVPLFFWFDAHLTLFWVPTFTPLYNLQINFPQKDLVLQI